jgi:hypothetical protein
MEEKTANALEVAAQENEEKEENAKTAGIEISSI